MVIDTKLSSITAAVMAAVLASVVEVKLFGRVRRMMFPHRVRWTQQNLPSLEAMTVLAAEMTL